MNSDLSRLRLVSIMEGISYILLLGIAMPLKYMFAMPMAVRVVGMAHGLLFILLVFAILRAHMVYQWGARLSLSVFIASFVPLGAFFMEVKLRKIAHDGGYSE